MNVTYALSLMRKLPYHFSFVLGVLFWCHSGKTFKYPGEMTLIIKATVQPDLREIFL